MPPRRSSRTRALDAQPTSAGSSSTPSDATSGKRKRGQSVAADETDVETENAIRSTSRAKPASSSRTRAKPSSTASTSKGGASVGPERTRGSRASTKTKSAAKLEEVPETEEVGDVDAEGEDEEQERDEDANERRAEAPPARKKSRRSVEDDEGHREEAAAVRKPSRRVRSRQVVEEEEEETEPPPAPRTRRSPAKPPSSKTTKTARSSRRPLRVESDVEEEGEQEEKTKEEDKEEEAIPISDDEDTLPIQTGRKAVSGKPAPKRSQPSSKSSPRSSKNAKTSQQEDVEEDTVLTPRPPKTAPVTPRKDPTLEQQATADEQEDDLDGFDQEYKATPRRAKRQDTDKNSSPSHASRTPKRAPPVAEEEEERSLLEPRVRPQTQSQQPPVEEVKGPKTRLVIHKMVLVNFKSYAGRQEIGPFHKVRLSTLVGVFILIMFVTSLSRQLLVPMAQASRTRSTRCCLCSDTVHQKCVRVNSQS